jgi:polar amino acid transport system permease protein
LWITLKISVMATIFGVIIGIISGLMRISDNPALRWTSIVYVELIRGSPLMVQILIWYFVLGTLINDLLYAYGFGQIPAFWYGIASLAFLPAPMCRKLSGPASSPSTADRPKRPVPWA